MDKELKQALNNISELNIVKVYGSKRKLLWYNFLIGISRGLGTVFGATIVVAIVLYILARIQWVPFVGEFVSQILNYLESNLPR